MAKGARKTFLNTAQQIGTSASQQQATDQAQAQQQYQMMMPQIMQMLTPGGDPAVTAATMGALGSSFGAAKQGVMDTAARTGNAAATNAALDNMAQSEGATAAQTAAQNVASQHQQAMGLLSSLYGLTQDQINNMLKNRVAANASYGTQTSGAGMQLLNGLLGAGGAAAGAYGGAKAGAAAG